MKRTLLAVLLLAGCSTGTSSGDADSSSKYAQTWAKDYGDTTCDEWKQQMTPAQQFAAAADMLVSARSVDGGKGLPPDSLVNDFEGGITTACVVGTMKLNDIGAALYVTEGSRYRP